MTLVLVLVAILLVALVLGIAREIHQRRLDRWLVPYLVNICRRSAPDPKEAVHLLLCIADHYEPRWGQAGAETALDRVAAWTRNYPRLFQEFRDSDGRRPRHTFFFPIDEYVSSHVDGLMNLCLAGFGEVEIHLHHDGDTSDSLLERLLEFKKRFCVAHGALARDRLTGELRYGFVHGNWALDNSLPDGSWCGVNNELDVLRETGCYADFTLPSAPSPAQTRKINSIYYAIDDPLRPKSHDGGIDVGAAPAPEIGLMLIQGPLVLDWRNRKWGLAPRIENGCLQAGQPPSIHRLDSWLRARVQVPSRPDWFFVKLHTHGATEANQKVLLGEPMVQFHRDLARLAQENPNFHYHYVTAREMYNLVKAAEAGWKGSVADARDFHLVWPANLCQATASSALNSGQKSPGIASSTDAHCSRA